jgi:hypothetical protein
MWFKLSSGNKIDKFSRHELMWLTSNRWFFSLHNVEGTFDKNKDFLLKFQYKSKNFSKFNFKQINNSLKYGLNVTDSQQTDYLRYMNYLLSYGSFKYSHLLHDDNKY